MKAKIFGAVLAAAILVTSPMTQAFAADAGDKAVTVVPISASIETFSDLAGHWARGAVDTLAFKGALPYKGPRFFPQVSVTRGELAIMLREALDIRMAYFASPNIADYFDDVSPEAPYASAVIDLVTAGVISTGGSFKGEDTVSREEMAQMVLGAYRYVMRISDAQSAGDVPFADRGEISPAYAADVAQAYREGLILGCGNDRFEPERAATRAEAAVLVVRAVGLVDEQARLVTVKPTAIVGDEELNLRIAIINNTQRPVTIEFSSGQKYDYEIYDRSGESLYRWSADKAFIAMMDTMTIEAGESLVFTDTLSGEDYARIKDDIAYMRVYITGQAPFINAEGYEIRLNTD